MDKRTLWLRSVLSAGMLLAARIAWAHDEDEGRPADPSLFYPGLRMFAAVLAVVIIVSVWYQLRKRAMLRGGDKDRKD